MSPESYLLQLFLLYHLGIAVGFMAILAIFTRWKKLQLQSIVAYRAHLFALLAATLLPLILIVWHVNTMTVLNDSVSILTQLNTSSVRETGVQHEIEVAQELAASGTEYSEQAFVFVSNSDDRLHIWDQLSYMLSPLIRYFALIAVIGTLVAIVRIITMLIATALVIRNSETTNLPRSVIEGVSVPILTNKAIQVPMAVGLLRPRILLPNSFLTNLEDQQLRHVLLHEFAHHQRKDLWVSLGNRFITALYWWSPAVALFNSKIRLYREIVCDQQAAATSHDQLGYAQSLLDCANLITRRAKLVVGHEFIGGSSELKSRLQRLMMADNSDRSAKSSVILGLAAFVILSASIPYAIAEFPQGAEQQRMFRQYRLQVPEVGAEIASAIDSRDYAVLDAALLDEISLNTPISGVGTPLMIAVRNQDQQMVNYLLEQGADPNQGASRRGNPLILAAARGNLDLIRLLIDAGADTNAIVPRDETPLISAARTGQLAAAMLLLESGARADLGVRTAASDGLEYRTPLNMAATPAMQQLLVSHLNR